MAKIIHFTYRTSSKRSCSQIHVIEMPNKGNGSLQRFVSIFQLMKLFSVAPFDQHLMLNGKKLIDQNATLASLGVLPECVLKLKVDEPMDGAYLIEEIPSAGPEEGFKGTGLLAGH
jgi:hypothetical protein